jgi:hypothetical protein
MGTRGRGAETARVLMTPDGKYDVYSGTRELGNLFIVSGLN